MSLVAEGLVVRYASRGFSWGRRSDERPAVDGVQVSVNKGEMVALVGGSGSGKSTLARCLVGMQNFASGKVSVDGTDVATLSRRETKALRRRVQMIYQDPYESLSPRQRVRAIVAEGLAIHGVDRDERDERVIATLVSVGLTPAESFLDRRPFELSGGQRQRVAIASSLVLEPGYLIADEPVSMLDVSVRAGVLTVLDNLRSTRDLGVLMITHDLATAVHVADRIVVMRNGRIVEEGTAVEIVHSPSHSYTKALLAATPGFHREMSTEAGDDQPGHVDQFGRAL